jgi:transposase InsO family protein
MSLPGKGMSRMLPDIEFDLWCRRLGLSESARRCIEQIRSSPPSRQVRSGTRNVSGRYPSKKMGVAIQFESHRVELAAIHEMEHDEDVLEYYDQPFPIKLNYRAKNERQIGVMHTPDFFVIRHGSAGWEEWKRKDELQKLAERMPHRYQQDESRWRCLPGEQYADGFGLYYRVRSSAEIDWVYQRNVLFLEDYFRADAPAMTNGTEDQILSLVASSPGIILSEVLQAVGGDSDTVYKMVAADRIYVDLHTAPLAEPQLVRVFRDRETALAYIHIAGSPANRLHGAPRMINVVAGSSIQWDGKPWQIINVGETKTALLATDGAFVELAHDTFNNLVKQSQVTGLAAETDPSTNAEVQERLAQASPEDFKEANHRYNTILPRLRGQRDTDAAVPERTLRFWLARYREAEQVHGCGYVGLLPRRRQSGNRERKLPETTLKLIADLIENDYETIKQKGRFEVYGALIRKCERQGVTIPSYKTFCKEVRRRPSHRRTLKRKGPRAAYQKESFYWELDLTTPRHGDRPFEIGHIDHTLLDIELVCSRTGHNLGRPWVTFLTDAYSRRLLALYLTFDAPSYRSCMMVLRECVRRHGRLPQILVVDGGGEFHSTYFETLLARYECTKKTRPGAKPRFGSVCERLFGTANTQFVHNLAGNTQIMRNVRQVTKEVNPRTHACWTLGGFYEYLCRWADEVYDTNNHPALGQSPREAFAAGLAQGGVRNHRLIPYDEDFRMFTLPTTRKGTVKVEPGRGVKINYVRYWSDAFRDPEIEKKQVPVRYDPFDAGVAYAFTGGRWVRCISEHYSHFRGRSEKELLIATAELRRRNQKHTKNLSITARMIADFLASAEANEALLSQRLRDAESRQVFAVIQGGRAEKKPVGAGIPEDAPPKPEPRRIAVESSVFVELYEEF